MTLVRALRIALLLGVLEIVALVGLASCAVRAMAQETMVVATAGSYHTERSGYCEFNPGLGVERSVGKVGSIVAGQYKNSLCRPSWYAGFSHKWFTSGPWSAGVTYIVITGYGETPLPGLLPTISYERGGWGANLIMATKGDLNRSVFGLQLKKPLNFLE